MKQIYCLLVFSFVRYKCSSTQNFIQMQIVILFTYNYGATKTNVIIGQKNISEGIVHFGTGSDLTGGSWLELTNLHYKASLVECSGK